MVVFIIKRLSSDRKVPQSVAALARIPDTSIGLELAGSNQVDLSMSLEWDGEDEGHLFDCRVISSFIEIGYNVAP